MSWADYMVECCMASRSLSEGCWDIVGEHSTLINRPSLPRYPAIIAREKICDHGGDRDIEMIQ